MLAYKLAYKTDPIGFSLGIEYTDNILFNTYIDAIKECFDTNVTKETLETVLVSFNDLARAIYNRRH